jgi:hypothetical protein
MVWCLTWHGKFLAHVSGRAEERSEGTSQGRRLLLCQKPFNKLELSECSRCKIAEYCLKGVSNCSEEIAQDLAQYDFHAGILESVSSAPRKGLAEVIKLFDRKYYFEFPLSVFLSSLITSHG